MINVSGFVTPEQNFAGLYKVSDNIRREEARNEAEQRRLEAGKAASMKFLADFTDPDKFLTGDPQDAHTLENLNAIKYEGIDLIKKGVDDAQLAFALTNRVSKLSQDTQRLKLLKSQKEEAAKALAKNPAIDIDRFNSAFNDIYYETDEFGNKRVKDISKLDPSKDYITEILNTKSIYTPAGFDEFVKGAGKVSDRKSLTVKDSRGALSKKDMKLVAPPFMEPEYENVNGEQVFTREFVPKHELAIDEEKPIIGKFMNKEGRQVDAQIRLLDRDVFNNLPKNALAYVMQEAKQYAIEEGIPVTDRKVELFARALAYDSLKNSGKQKTEAEEIVVQQAAPAPRTSVTINNRSGGSDVPVIDLWTDFKGTVDNAFSKGETVPAKNIPNAQYKIIKETLINRGVKEKLIGLNDWVAQQSTDGGAIVIYDKKTKKPLGTFTENDFDIAGNQPLGAKSKTEAAKNRGQQGAVPAQSNKPQTLAEKMKAAANKPK
jgi:hypothetical protein